MDLASPSRVASTLLDANFVLSQGRSEVAARVKVLMQQKKIDEVVALCDATKSIFTRILSAGLRAYPRGKTAMEETLAEYGTYPIQPPGE